MELRAHHLLCIPMYQGHGYSKEFCAHMVEVIERMPICWKAWDCAVEKHTAAGN